MNVGRAMRDEKERSGRAARDAGFKEAAEYIRAPIVRPSL